MGDYYRGGRIAQLGEHRPYKPGVTGSSPVPPTNFQFKVQSFVNFSLTEAPNFKLSTLNFELIIPGA
jgi:hypothetical protein